MNTHRSRWLFGAILLMALGLLHCVEDTKRPIEALQLSVSSFTLPSQDFAKAGFAAGSIPNLGTLVGDSSGLYHLSNNKLSSIGVDPVVGITPWRGQYMLVASPKELSIFDGELQGLPLKDKLKLQDTEITAIAAQAKDVLWIGTKAHLWRLKHDTLEAFTSIKDVKAISSYVGAKDVVVLSEKDKLTVLRTNEKGELSQLTLPSDGPSFQQMAPGLGDSLWGLADKALYLREQADDKSRWVRYILGGESPDSTDPVHQMTIDANTGRLWALNDKTLFSIEPKKVLKAPMPDAIKKIVGIAATGEGHLWINDGTQLHQFVRQSTENVTYEGQVALFMDKNCWRCHKQIGPGRPLDSYKLIKENIKAIITAVESGSMPADKKPLTAGDVNLLKKWQEQGFAK